MKYEDMSMSQKLIYGMEELTKELELNCKNDTNNDGDCPKCSKISTVAFLGRAEGLYKSNYAYYLKHDSKWYVWLRIFGWRCMNDGWCVIESEEGLRTIDGDCDLNTELELVELGSFSPEEYTMEMRLVKGDSDAVK